MALLFHNIRCKSQYSDNVVNDAKELAKKQKYKIKKTGTERSTECVNYRTPHSVFGTAFDYIKQQTNWLKHSTWLTTRASLQLPRLLQTTRTQQA